MMKLFQVTATYLALGLAVDLFPREFTKANDFTVAHGLTQLFVALGKRIAATAGFPPMAAAT